MSQARLTAYAQYVFSNVKEAARVGQGMYSYDELAEMVGLKPTHNFRRRINEMVSDGSLKLCPAFTPRGGIENRFMIEITHTEMADPNWTT
jgi:hypothetical protein